MMAKERANILIEALPYIREYHDQIIVIKYGGNAMIDDELKRAVIQDVLLLRLVGIHIVLVHGGGPDISEMLRKVDIPSRFENGLRVTTKETMEIVQMVLCGKVNKDLVGLLEGQGVGLSGMDGGLFRAVPYRDESEVDYGYVGEVIDVNPKIVLDVIEKGYIPVVSSVAAGMHEPASYNINADTAASKLASALHAKKLILLTDVPGLMKDPGNPDTLIRRLKVSQVPALVMSGIISGGMIPKVDCCVEAVRQGVERANIQDGRLPHSILIELLSDDGIGTMFS
ncbi:acetylglutamate kinase [Dubosiella muris]|uniref:Acetylglutamate kinase n=1 Tax=Dubosiella muris TaxID=3038133 RepID=A0AC61R885_9FIRM|nr:acetylglutamate kinase [Dubosiella muris]TGY65828.1 acetylglutamate kinase [Dubosiella muris]